MTKEKHMLRYHVGCRCRPVSVCVCVCADVCVWVSVSPKKTDIRFTKRFKVDVSRNRT